jgi:hypothetical protein
MVYHVMDVELVEQGVAIFGHRRGKDNDFIQLTHPLHESINSRPFDNIHIMILSLDLHGNRHVGLM